MCCCNHSIGPIPVMVAVKVTFNIDLIALTVSWKVCTVYIANKVLTHNTKLEKVTT